MPAARLNKEMTAKELFRNQQRNISFRDMDSMVLSVCWFKAIMGTFATKKILQGNPSLIPVIAEQIKTDETFVQDWICLNIGH